MREFFLTCNVHAHRYPEARSKWSSVCRTGFSHNCCKMALASFVGSSCFPAYHRRSGHWSSHPAGHSTEYSPLHTSHSYKPFALEYHMCNVRSSHPVVRTSRYRRDHKNVCRNRCPNQVLSVRVCCLERLFHCHLSTKVALIWLYQDLCSWKTDLWSHRLWWRHHPIPPISRPRLPTIKHYLLLITAVFTPILFYEA